MTSVVGVVILLGGLIFFHEFGHYIIAKLFGVKVEVFSLGFGKKILQRQWGETIYCLSLVPLGGYVKLMGDDPYKGVPAGESDRAFATQKLYKRFLIVAAGPTANLVLALFLFLIVFWFGQPVVSSRIGEVQRGTPAWEAGLRAKDLVEDISGQKIHSWNELEDGLKNRLGDKVELLVQRGATELKIPITVTRVRTKNVYGEDEEAGGIKGIGPNPLASMVGISDPKSVAAKAGLKTGDLITKVDTVGVATYNELEAALRSQWGENKPITITYKRREPPTAKTEPPEQALTLTLPEKPEEDDEANVATEALGMYPSDIFVREVTAGSPAEKGGLKAGDRVVKIGTKPAYSFDGIVDYVQEAGGKDEMALFSVDRGGQSVVLPLKPIFTTQEDPLTHSQIKKYMVGFAPFAAYHEADLTKLQIHSPVELVERSFQETFVLAYRMLVSIVKLAIGKISVKNLGGPVLIASVAGKSLDAGVIPFLQMMALISINLFLLNLFPVPILDGGHLFFFAIEGVKGRPVSIRTMEIANQVGMFVILMLVALTLFNDITRILVH